AGFAAETRLGPVLHCQPGEYEWARPNRLARQRHTGGTMSAVIDAGELQALKSGFDPDPEKSWSLPSRIYRDTKFLPVEQANIFWRSWQFLCHIEQLREPGSYVTGSMQGRSIFAARDAKGELRAFYNVCQHRGHELLSGAGQTRLIVCPYHAWSYSLNGALAAAPGSQALKNFHKEDFCLRPIRIEVFDGLVFVNLDLNAATL